jgi:3-deoxy-manno-octulosonate cytidylyltransferase (CMP-KDO synthetase)
VKTIAVIPARMASSRFPGKPMELIHGIPMIGHCFFRANMCPDLDATFVATCDQEIFDYIKSIGGAPIMTSSEHERASDRAAEAMLSVEKRYRVKVEILTMIQGDEPMDTPTMISDAVISMRNDKTIGVVNLMGAIESEREFEDPNTVKVVVDSKDYALFFSREPIPSRKKGVSQVPMYKQICVIPFRRNALLEFNKLEETPLEIIESVDMLRVLESRGRVKMVRTSEPSIGVDTPDDLREVQKIMEFDSLRLEYTSKSSVGE